MKVKLSFGSSIITLFLFFLPWIDIQCSKKRTDNSILTQSGIELVTGNYTLPEKAKNVDNEPERFSPSFLIGGSLLLSAFSVFLLGRSVFGKSAVNLDHIRWVSLISLLFIAIQFMIGLPAVSGIIKSFQDSQVTSKDLFAIRRDLDIVLLPAFYGFIASIFFTVATTIQRKST